MAKRKLPRDPALLELSKTMTNKEIAERFGVSYSHVASCLTSARQELGINPPRHNDTLGRPRATPSDDELLELSKTLLQREIAEEYDVTPSYISNQLRRVRKERGLPPAKRGRPRKGRAGVGYDGPPRDEFADALERWGMNGCAEEYDVDAAQIAAWMRRLDL